MKDHFKKFSQGYNQWLDIAENLEKLNSRTALAKKIQTSASLSDVFPFHSHDAYEGDLQRIGETGETVNDELIRLMRNLIGGSAESLRKSFKFQMHQPDYNKILLDHEGNHTQDKKSFTDEVLLSAVDGEKDWEWREILGLNQEIPMSLPFDNVFLDLAQPFDDVHHESGVPHKGEILIAHTLFFFRNNWIDKNEKDELLSPFAKQGNPMDLLLLSTQIEIAIFIENPKTGDSLFRFLPFFGYIPKEQEGTFRSMDIQFIPIGKQFVPICEDILKAGEEMGNSGMLQNFHVKIYKFFQMLYLKKEGEATQSKHGFKKPAQVEARSPKKQKKHPHYEYHLLEIKPNVTLKSESENGKTGVKQRRHMVRGFYRNYKRPIRSGPNVGKTRVFIPSHARGDETLGVIRKDYVFAEEGN